MEGTGDLAAPHREHLEALARMGDPGAQWELDNLPELPPLAAHIWAAFMDLCRTRQSSGIGPASLSRFEIRLFEQDEGMVLEPWERRAIFALDAAWLASVQPEPKGGAS
jgi:hypothetical protein